MFLLATVLLLPVRAQDTTRVVPEVWFSPNLYSRDYFALFQRPNAWAHARSKIGVFKVYQQQLLPGCPSAPNCYAGFEANRVFQKLRAWGIDVALESGAVKEHTCTGLAAAQPALRAIEAVEKLGGKVKYVSMDEPLLGGQHTIDGRTCRMTPGQIAAETAVFIKAIRKARPGIKVGDIEPYPAQTWQQQALWLSLLEKKGARLDFYHLDADYNAFRSTIRAPAAAIRTIRAEAHKRGIPFGIIVWGNSKDNDCDYYKRAIEWAKKLAAMLTPTRPKGALPLLPEHLLIQSWTGRVPTNLPEGTAAYTHTRIVNESLLILTGAQDPGWIKTPKKCR